MAVEGDLRDVELTDMIEMLCSDNRRAKLVVRRSGEEAVLFFDGGDVVHATLGRAVGDEAVRRVIDWSEGDFLLASCDAVPGRTTASRWSQLVLEGAQRRDEQRRDLTSILQGAGAAPSLAPRAGEMEIALLGLLARLEHVMSRLDDRKVRKNPELALEVVAEMLVEIEAGTGDLRPLGQLLLAASGRYPGLVPLAGDLRSARDLAVAREVRAWRGDAADRRRRFAETANGLIFVLELRLEELAAPLGEADVKEQWRESCGVLLSDLGGRMNLVSP